MPNIKQRASFRRGGRLIINSDAPIQRLEITNKKFCVFVHYTLAFLRFLASTTYGNSERISSFLSSQSCFFSSTVSSPLA